MQLVELKLPNILWFYKHRCLWQQTGVIHDWDLPLLQSLNKKLKWKLGLSRTSKIGKFSSNKLNRKEHLSNLNMVVRAKLITKRKEEESEPRNALRATCRVQVNLEAIRTNYKFPVCSWQELAVWAVQVKTWLVHALAWVTAVMSRTSNNSQSWKKDKNGNKSSKCCKNLDTFDN